MAKITQGMHEQKQKVDERFKEVKRARAEQAKELAALKELEDDYVLAKMTKDQCQRLVDAISPTPTAMAPGFNPPEVSPTPSAMAPGFNPPEEQGSLKTDPFAATSALWAPKEESVRAVQ